MQAACRVVAGTSAGRTVAGLTIKSISTSPSILWSSGYDEKRQAVQSLPRQGVSIGSAKRPGLGRDKRVWGLRRLVGEPYKPGGRGIGGYDCLGVVLAYLGLEVPGGVIPESLAIRRLCKPTKDLRPGDILVMKNQNPVHLAVVVEDHYVVEGIEEFGVIRSSLQLAVEKATHFYRPSECS